MLAILSYILATIIMIHVVVLVHEMGHFVVAKIFKIKIISFKVGFGKVLYSYNSKNDINWEWCLIPLGGYVALLDSRSIHSDTQLEKHAFNNKKVWQKILVYLAGPLTNICCAIIFYTILLNIGIFELKPIIADTLPNSIAARAMIQNNSTIVAINNTKTPTWTDVSLEMSSSLGVDDSIELDYMHNNKLFHSKLDIIDWSFDGINFDSIKSIGFIPYIPTNQAIIYEMVSFSPAEKYGLKINDKIVAINNKKIEDYDDYTNAMKTQANKEIKVTILRNDKLINYKIETSWKFDDSFNIVGYLGYIPPPYIWPPEKLRHLKYNFFGATKHATIYMIKLLKFNFVMLYKLITRTIPLASLSGPIGFFKFAYNAINAGWIMVITSFCTLNILLAFLNLLPIPGLDGGNILFCCYE